MPGTVRGSAAFFVGLAALSLSLGGCKANDEPSQACGDLCERLASVECTSETPEECRSDCAAVEADLPEACRGPWNAFLACATDAEWTCDTSTGSPEVVGCATEESTLDECVTDGGCSDEDGSSGTGLDDDGRSISYGTRTACGYCPMPLSRGSLEGDPCASASDCAEVCCACPDRDMAARVCLDGLCADACDPALDLCSL